MKNNLKKQKGFGVVEVLVALALVSIIILVIGKVLISIQRIYQASALKNEAYLYAQESLEVLSATKEDFFGCSSANGSLTSTTCTRYGDGQTCTLVEPYQSCWTQYPEGLASFTKFYLTESGGVWSLNELVGGAVETVPQNNTYTRVITLENAANLDSVVEDNVKQATVQVFWTNRDLVKEVSLSTIFTAWKSL